MSAPTSPRICFVTASGQNVFFGELFDAMRDELSRAGFRTETAVDHFPPVAEDLVYVVVPHEFMPLTFPRAHPTRDQYRRTIALCTEQPGTVWFEQAAVICNHCAVTVDINHLGVDALREKGIDARLMRFGYVPSWDHWGGDRERDRPVDVSFMGGHTERRAAMLGALAPVLDDRRGALHVFETAVPHTEDSPHFLSGERKWRELGRSKLIVNVHRDELGYFEWQRVLGAMANGCVVVTEHSLGCAPLVPGEHFVSTSYDSLPYVVEGLLGDPGRLAAIRDAGYEMLTQRFRLADSIHVLAEAAAEIAGAPIDAPRHTSGAHPAPRPAPRRPTMTHLIADDRSGEQAIRMAVKHLLLEQRELRKDLDALIRPPGPEPETTERTFGPWEHVRPRVSVLVSLHNYAGQVPHALRSVARSSIGDLEVIVVDDASTDASSAAVEQAAADHPWLPVKLITRGRNGGLAAARNLAAEHARAPLVFILDADNAVRRRGIERLLEALDADPGAGFAYGILEQVTGGRRVGLMSWLGWDPLRLRYDNFIDAMALLRRDVLLEAGGYTSDRRLHGWEDFALWCELAARGVKGVRVPQIVATYTAAVHSMISLTNIDSAEAVATLVRRYPFLEDGVPAPPVNRASTA